MGVSHVNVSKILSLYGNQMRNGGANKDLFHKTEYFLALDFYRFVGCYKVLN